MKPIRKNDVLQLSIAAMSSEGSGIGKIDNFAIFVPRTAVGDVIDAKIVKVTKKYAFGIVDKIIKNSEDRVESDCPYSGKCGGCIYRHISYDAELKIKEKKVEDAIVRIGGFKNFKVDSIIGDEDRCHYRNKAQIPLGVDKDGKLIMGFYAKHSHRIIDATSCLLQPKVFDEITDIFRKWHESFGDTIYDETTHTGVLRHLYIRYGEKTGEIMVCVVINGNKLKNADKLIEMLTKDIPEIKSFVVNQNHENTNVILGENCQTLFGSETIADELCGLKFNLSPLSFYQVNRNQAEKLYEKATEYADLKGDETLLDLYCGTGTIGLSMAKKAKKIIGIEIIKEAIENAKVNAKVNKIDNSEFFCADAFEGAKILSKRQEKIQVVVLDPPRKGCSQDLLNTVVSLNPEKIVYVSCDPATLGRDLKILNEKNYTIKKATPVDLFPGTIHCETVCLLSHKDPQNCSPSK